MISHLKVLFGSDTFQFLAFDQQKNLFETGVCAWVGSADRMQELENWRVSYLADKDHALVTAQVYWVHGEYTISSKENQHLVTSVLQTKQIVAEVYSVTSPLAVHYVLPDTSKTFRAIWAHKHAFEYLLEGLVYNEAAESELRLLIHENKVLIALVGGGKLKRSSFHIFSNGTDLAYFLLLMLQQESLAQDTPIRICAGISPQSQLDQQLSVFFSNLIYDL